MKVKQSYLNCLCLCIASPAITVTVHAYAIMSIILGEHASIVEKDIFWSFRKNVFLERPIILLLLSRHAPPKGWKCHILASYQMWFCQKLLRNAKKNTSNSQGIKITDFWFLSKFWPKIAQKRQKTRSCWFWHYQMWFFTKISKSWLFYWHFWHFWAMFGKTTSGSLPKCDIFNPWAVYVCCIDL